MATSSSPLSFLLLLLPILLISLTAAQTPVAPPPASATCNGIFLSYSVKTPTKLPPNTSDPTQQPYRFESTLSVLNNGLDELKSWQVFVGFQNDELLVSATNAVLADGTTLPAQVGNGSVFAGYPNTDLKTAIETAGDLTQMGVQIELVGTEFGSPGFPLPTNISLTNDGFICPKPTIQGKSQMQVCCSTDPKFKVNTTVDEGFLPRQNGDLTIMYDVTKTYDSYYFADVTIANHNPLGRLDNWALSWDWMRGEFIFSMKGAYPSLVDASKCIYGPQGQFYKNMDFSTALNCDTRPTIIDLPLDKTNDTVLGMVPFCCRNGTILPPTMDPSKSISAFQMQVYKMPPDLNRSQLSPPQNWQISGSLNPDYQCGPPVRVSPSRFPNPSGLSDSTAVASWQVVCNITVANGIKPRCCVSFSSFYNESIIPCRTCACGCPSNSASTCSTTAPALLLPTQALLVPFDNRTDLTNSWAGLKHFSIPNPRPCGDNCGVSVNWHLLTDYNGGWSARITLFNWGEGAFVDWFTAVEMDKAAAGFQKAYSFNGSAMTGVNNNTIFMQGLPGLNYLVGEAEAANPNKDPPVPGKQQSVITFTKKKTPGIDTVAGDGFPSKVFFNGEECSLPEVIPSNAYRLGSTLVSSVLLAAVILMLMQQ